MESKLVLLMVSFAVITIGVGHAQSNSQAMQWAQQSQNAAVGKPQFHLNGGGSGNNGRNWNAGVNAGLGIKAWESRNGKHSFGVGANYGQQFGRFQGQSYKSRPDVGVGAGYRFRFGGKK